MNSTAPTPKKKSVEFDWNQQFERSLARMLITYRAARKEFLGTLEMQLAYERDGARDFMTKLRTLIDQHAPAVIQDSDVAEAVDAVEVAHDGARIREARRLGDQVFAE